MEGQSKKTPHIADFGTFIDSGMLYAAGAAVVLLESDLIWESYFGY